ncbi:hypothetical protein PHET_08072 [Paragonimus heterotremus]|uniref:Uncharacterized protein n=1 Tax=Paragonimus heterotremus TaxID=100268 RepID=A0A8J4T629_9TREM|nr:hypothetical protein PHET_08072 [Paragonimus heterotremus]
MIIALLSCKPPLLLLSGQLYRLWQPHMGTYGKPTVIVNVENTFIYVRFHSYSSPVYNFQIPRRVLGTVLNTASSTSSKYAGTTLGSLLRKVCQLLSTDDFAKIFGWTDKRNQGRQINGSKILLTIQGSIVNHSQLTTPIDAVDIFVKIWFYNARDRAGGRTKKYKSTNKS